MTEDTNNPPPDSLNNEGFQPLQKGFVPARRGETIAQDGFTPSTPGKPEAPPQTVPNMNTSVQAPSKKE